MKYIVAAIGNWNKALFDEYVAKLFGIWNYVSTPIELNAKLAACFDPEVDIFSTLALDCNCRYIH